MDRARPSTRRARPNGPRLSPGISVELARWRAAHYSDVAYKFDVRLDAARIAGTVVIELGLRRREDIVLDWRPRGGTASVDEVNGRVVPTIGRPGHLCVPRHATHVGTNAIVVRFDAPIATGGTAITRYEDPADGARYVYTLFVPAEASTIFPCFDQPDLKARFTLAIDTPTDWRVVSNAPLAGKTHANGGRRIHAFATTPPISTYLFAFAAGPFARMAGSGATAAIHVRRSQRSRAAAALRATLALSDASLTWLARETGVRFPFVKYELVLVPEFQYGGMEHAGATFLREAAVLLPRTADRAAVLRRAHLVCHENAHQWFGDLVTMRWFDDLWLKEGFANLMAAKQLVALVPELQPEPARLFEEASALRMDASSGAVPLHRPLGDLLDAKSSYGPTVYQKAPAVLRMLEREIGRSRFRAGVREYLRRHAFGAADWRDLVREMSRAAGRSLARWARAWVLRAGAPTVRLRLVRGRDGSVERATLEQTKALGRVQTWPFGFDARIWRGPAKCEVIALRSTTRSTRMAALEGRTAPAAVLFNDAGDAYGSFPVDAGNAEALLGLLQTLGDPARRALVWRAAWQAVRDGALAADRYVMHALERLPGESDESVAAPVAVHVVFALRRYVASPRRLTEAAERELLRWRATARSGAMATLAWRTFVGIAMSDAARATLERAAMRKRTSHDLDERFRVIERLLVIGHPRGARHLASEQRQERSGDARRLAFAAGASSASAAMKRRYLERFLDDHALPDAWIEAALPGFNAPEHAAITAPLLDHALAALSRLKRERTIFLVDRWLAAFAGGQHDERAARAIERAASRAGRDQDLALKLREAADEVRVTVRARACSAAFSRW